MDSLLEYPPDQATVQEPPPTAPATSNGSSHRSHPPPIPTPMAQPLELQQSSQSSQDPTFVPSSGMTKMELSSPTHYPTETWQEGESYVNELSQPFHTYNPAGYGRQPVNMETDPQLYQSIRAADLQMQSQSSEDFTEGPRTQESGQPSESEAGPSTQAQSAGWPWEGKLRSNFHTIKTSFRGRVNVKLQDAIQGAVDMYNDITYKVPLLLNFYVIKCLNGDFDDFAYEGRPHAAMESTQQEFARLWKDSGGVFVPRDLVLYEFVAYGEELQKASERHVAEHFQERLFKFFKLEYRSLCQG
ncbi:hypothetical protein HDU76_010990, partial [Blyttiomyces sp. JEL0837]